MGASPSSATPLYLPPRARHLSGRNPRLAVKADIHPEYHPVVFVDGEHEIITKSTRTSRETREIDGVEHYVIEVHISSSTHPFWTGSQRVVDTAGRIERFNRKYGRK